MKVSVAHLKNLTEYANLRQLENVDLLEQEGIKISDLESPLGILDEDVYLEILEQIVSRSDDDHFGVNYGCFLNLKSLGLIMDISLNADRIDQAVELLNDFLGATLPMVKATSSVNDEQYLLSVKCTIKNRTLARQILDSVFCVMYRELRLMLHPSDRITLRVPYASHQAISLALKERVFQGDDFTFVFDRKLLSAELNRHGIKQIEFLLPKFLAELNSNIPLQPFSARVRHTLLNLCSPELPSIDQLVLHFPLSRRSLQRELLKEGTSYRALANGIKQELSNYLEQSDRFRTQEIASILGYSESSAYLNAKKRWVS